MNKTLMRVVLQQLVFLNSLSEEQVDLDTTCKAIEDIQATLMELSPQERGELVRFAEEEMAAEYRDYPEALHVLTLLRGNLAAAA